MKYLVLLAALVALTGCGRDEVETAAPATAGVADGDAVAAGPTTGGIPWFAGSIEEAFAAAKAGNKPVFLYWGAVWCPPCHELKATIFQQQRFIEQSKLFVPVYLDGDTDRAQRYGEQFGVMGYPTVIIFSPAGQEITRIPGGMDIEQYVGVLELALNALRPVSELLAAAQAGEPLSAADWRLLASYSWGQDRGRALGEAPLHATLRELALACPATEARTCNRLRMLALEDWLAEGDERDAAFGIGYREWLDEVLADDAASRDNLNLFMFSSDGLVTELAAADERATLRDRILAVLESAETDPALTTLVRLDSIYGWVDAHKALLDEEQTLSAEQQASVAERAKALHAQLDKYQRHAGLNTLWQLYLAAGLEAEARAALAEGIATSEQPYYFMQGMGTVEHRAGNDAAAVDWYRQAWEQADGPATRLQWGSQYVRVLMKLSPDALDTIAGAGNEVLAALLAQEQGLAQRNSGGIRRWGVAMAEWLEPAEGAATTAAARQAIADDWREQLAPLCGAAVEGSDAAVACTAFMGTGSA